MSISLISGISISSDLISQHYIDQELARTNSDFSLYSQQTNYNAFLDKLDGFKDPSNNFKEYLASYAVSRNYQYSSRIDPTGGSVDWTDVWDHSNATSEIDHSKLNSTRLFGISENFFTDDDLKKRYDGIMSFDTPINLTKNGVYTDTNTAQRLSLVVGQNITIGLVEYDYEYDFSDNLIAITKYTYDLTDIPLLGIFNISKPSKFLDIFRNYYYRNYEENVIIEDNIFIGNLNYSLELKNKIQYESGFPYYDDYNGPITYKIIIDYSFFQKMNPSAIGKAIDRMKLRISVVTGISKYDIDCPLEWVIENLQMLLLMNNILFIIISFPVIILGWYLCKTNWNLSYQRRRREIALLKVRGGYSSQIKFMFYLEASIVGFIGGTLGILGGSITAPIVVDIIYPSIFQETSFFQIFGAILSNNSISLMTWLIGGVAGIILSLLAVKTPLKEFCSLNVIDGLQKYNESSQNQLPKKKKDFIIFLVGFIPIAYTLAIEYLFPVDFNYYVPILTELTGIFTVLLPFAPFALVYGLTKLLCRNMTIFEKMIYKINSYYDKTISIFTTKSILRNQGRSFRLIFIVAMALSFTIMATTLKSTEYEYKGQLHTIQTGDGLMIEHYPDEDGNYYLNNMSDYLWDIQDQLNFSSFNYRINIGYSGLQGEDEVNDYMYDSYYGTYQKPIDVTVISAENYTKFMNLRNEWFVDMSASEAMEKLKTPNSVLIPEDLQKQGYKVNDNITIQYAKNITSIGYEDNVIYAEKNVTIAGIYITLPLVHNQYYNSQNFIVAGPSTFIDEKIIIRWDTIKYAFYPMESETIADFNVTTYAELIQEKAGGYVNLYDYQNDFEEEIYDNISYSIINFLNLETYFLVILVSLGIAIIMYISIGEKSHEMGLLRARGVEPKVLYKIQIAEGGTLIFLGSLFSLTGIIGALSVIIQLNNLNTSEEFGGGGTLSRSINIPLLSLLIQLFAAIAIFMLSIIAAVAIQIKKSDVKKIGELLRVDG